MTAHLIVGIDPGAHTGYAVWCTTEKRLLVVESLPVHRAMDRVRELHRVGMLRHVVFEDARQRRGYFGATDAAQASRGAGVREGVGSVKRDCGIWQDFLVDLDIPFEARKPQAGTTKWAASYFARVSGWTAKTNQHARDAACLVINAAALPMIANEVTCVSRGTPRNVARTHRGIAR